MSLSVDKETPARREDLTSYSPPAPSLQPALEPPSTTDFMSMQSGVGNSALASSASNASFALSSNGSQYQSAYGNAAVAQEAESLQTGAPSIAPVEPAPANNPPQNKPSSAESAVAVPMTTHKASAGKLNQPPESKPASSEPPAEPLTNYKASKPRSETAARAIQGAKSDKALDLKLGETETPPGRDPSEESKKSFGAEARAPGATDEKQPAGKTNGAPAAVKDEKKKEAEKTLGKGKGEAAKEKAATPAGGEKAGAGVAVGGAVGGPARATTPAPVAITAKDPEGILEQLTDVPPTQAASAYEQAEAASPAALENQKGEAQDSLPVVPAPTGLPSKGSAAREKTDAAAPKAPAAELGAEKKGREAEPYETKVEEAPRAPMSQPTDLKVTGKTDEEKAAETARSAQATLDSVSIDTTEVTTSAGERPSVDTTGEADPSQMDTAGQGSVESVRKGKQEAARDISRDYGENDIFPEPSDEILTARKALSVASPAAGEPIAPLVLPPEAAAGLNASLGPVFAERIGAQKKEYAAGEEKYDQDRVTAREKADGDIEQLEDQARETQTAEQTRAKEEVGGAREEWRSELDKVEKDYEEKADKADKENRSNIVQEKAKGEKEAAKHLEEAEKKAANEKKQAEEKAAAEKEKGNKKSGGFWGWAKRAASALIDGIKGALNFIYDTLRKVVKAVFEVAKKLVLAVIEVARMAIVGLIKAFGAILKGLVSVVFIAFPEIGKKINAKIDKAVDFAVKVVNKAADLLKKGVAAVLDFVANLVDSLLGLVQSIFNGILTVIGMIIRGEFMELMRRIGSLILAAQSAPDQFETAALEELLGGNLDEPLSPEELMQAGVAPPSLGAGGGASAEGAAPSELPAAPWHEGNVGVDEVDPNMELSPELAEELAAKTNGEGEVELASSEDKSRTMAAVMAEVSPETAGSSQEEAKYPDDGLNPTQRAEIKWQLMKDGIAKWWDDNWPTIIAAAAAAILGFIALNIVTGGAITAALPVIMGILGPLFVGVTILTIAGHVKNYVSLGWEGQILPAGKSLAKGLAAGAIELISWVTFKAGGALLKGAKAVVKGGLKLVKAGAKMIARGAKFLISKGKVLFQGIARSGVGRMFTKLKAMGEGLLKRLRFKKFRITVSGRWFTLEGYINPWIMIAKGERKGEIEWVEKLSKKGGYGKNVAGKNSADDLIEGLLVKGSKARPNYRHIADVFFENTVSASNVIHHAIEQQVLKRFKGIFTLAQIHGGKNLRAIIRGAFNSEVHLARIRVLWNNFYTALEGLSVSRAGAQAAFKRYAAHIDEFIKAMEKYMENSKEIAEALAKNDKDAVREMLRKEAERLLKTAAHDPSKGLKEALEGIN